MSQNVPEQVAVTLDQKENSNPACPASATLSSRTRPRPGSLTQSTVSEHSFRHALATLPTKHVGGGRKASVQDTTICVHEAPRKTRGNTKNTHKQTHPVRGHQARQPCSLNCPPHSARPCRPGHTGCCRHAPHVPSCQPRSKATLMLREKLRHCYGRHLSPPSYECMYAGMMVSRVCPVAPGTTCGSRGAAIP